MTAHVVEVDWLDARETVSMAELSRVCGLSETELGELMEYGALVPLDKAATGRLFSSECIAPLRRAARMRRDFDLDFAVACCWITCRIDAGARSRCRPCRPMCGAGRPQPRTNRMGRAAWSPQAGGSRRVS
jgi:hypothetical protein